MRRCIDRLTLPLFALMLLFTAVSCSKEIDFGFKDLCYYHPHTAPVRLNVDWSKFNHIEKPTGMSVYVWPEDPAQEFNKYISHDIDGVTLNLLEGTYNTLVFNQIDQEFASLKFEDMDDFHKAKIRVKQTKSGWYATKDPDTKIGEEPEWIAIDSKSNIMVTEEMVKKAEDDYLASIGKSQRSVTRVNDVATLVPKSIIKKVDLYIHLENLVYLRSSMAAFENMAEGCFISTKKTTSSQVTHTINSWNLIYDKDDNGYENLMKGVLKASISTFGLPDGHSGNPEDTNLLVELLLVDNVTTVLMKFPIGDIMADLNSYDGSVVDAVGRPIWPEVHIYWPEPLPEVEPVGGSSGGLDIGVSEWGDEIVTILPMF